MTQSVELHTVAPMPELQDVVMWLVTSFGADAALWAEMAIASLWRQGEVMGAAEWDSLRQAVTSVQEPQQARASLTPVH